MLSQSWFSTPDRLRYLKTFDQVAGAQLCNHRLRSTVLGLDDSRLESKGLARGFNFRIAECRVEL
jgi:hypothetical protein